MKKKDTKKLILYQEFLIAASTGFLSVVLGNDPSVIAISSILIASNLFFAFLSEQCLINRIAIKIAYYIDRGQVRDAVHVRRSGLWISVIGCAGISLFILLFAPNITQWFLKEHNSGLIIGLRLSALSLLLRGLQAYFMAWYTALEKQHVISQSGYIEIIGFVISFLIQKNVFSLMLAFAYPLAVSISIFFSVLYYLLADQTYYVPYLSKARRSLKTDRSSSNIAKDLTHSISLCFLGDIPFGFSILVPLLIGMSFCQNDQLYGVVILTSSLLSILPLSISFPFLAKAGNEIKNAMDRSKVSVKQTITKSFQSVMTAAGFGIGMELATADLLAHIFGNEYLYYFQFAAVLAILAAMLGYGVMVLYVLNLEASIRWYMVIGSVIEYFAIVELQTSLGSAGMILGVAVAVLAELFLCFTKISNRFENEWIGSFRKLLLILLCALASHGCAAACKLMSIGFQGTGVLLLGQWLLLGLIEFAIYFWTSGLLGLRRTKKGKRIYAAG